jgi:hypothetical protein
VVQLEGKIERLWQKEKEEHERTRRQLERERRQAELAQVQFLKSQVGDLQQLYDSHQTLEMLLDIPDDTGTRDEASPVKHKGLANGDTGHTTTGEDSGALQKIIGLIDVILLTGASPVLNGEGEAKLRLELTEVRGRLETMSAEHAKTLEELRVKENQLREAQRLVTRVTSTSPASSPTGSPALSHISSSASADLRMTLSLPLPVNVPSDMGAAGELLATRAAAGAAYHNTVLAFLQRANSEVTLEELESKAKAFGATLQSKDSQERLKRIHDNTLLLKRIITSFHREFLSINKLT